MEKFLAKLERRTVFPSDEKAAILALPFQTTVYASGESIVTKGDNIKRCIIVESGFVSCRNGMRNGSHQIVGFGIPGDMLNLRLSPQPTAEFDIKAHGPTTVISVSSPDIVTLTDRYPVVAKALWEDTLIDGAVARRWIANLGRRRGRERIAHLLIECYYRLCHHLNSPNMSFILPLTQTDIGEAVGLSLVHVNRSVQGLRAAGLIAIKGRRISIMDLQAMIDLSEFDETYLRLAG